MSFKCGIAYATTYICFYLHGFMDCVPPRSKVRNWHQQTSCLLSIKLTCRGYIHEAFSFPGYIQGTLKLSADSVTLIHDLTRLFNLPNTVTHIFGSFTLLSSAFIFLYSSRLEGHRLLFWLTEYFLYITSYLSAAAYFA